MRYYQHFLSVVEKKLSRRKNINNFVDNYRENAIESASNSVVDKAPLVFISSCETPEIQQWLSILKKHLPDENILLPEQINEQQLLQIKIAIIANPDPKIVKQFPNLIWLQSLWAGVERVVNELDLSQIKLVRLIDPQLTKTMTEAVIAWTLYLHRNMPEYAVQQKNKHWQPLPCLTAEQTRISVLGAGELGCAAIKALTQLNYQVSFWSRTAKKINNAKNHVGDLGLTTILKNTDILINLLPLTTSTHHLLNYQKLMLLPKGGKLINFSRGAVIDTNALIDLLNIKHISHAVLDVFEVEPLPTEDKLWQHSHITVLPHISAPTNMESAATIVAKNINNYYLNAVIPNSVDLSKGY